MRSASGERKRGGRTFQVALQRQERPPTAKKKGRTGRKKTDRSSSNVYGRARSRPDAFDPSSSHGNRRPRSRGGPEERGNAAVGQITTRVFSESKKTKLLLLQTFSRRFLFETLAFRPTTFSFFPPFSRSRSFSTLFSLSPFLSLSLAPSPPLPVSPTSPPHLIAQVVAAGLKETRDRIESVKNTKKITDAMKLVAAAKVRRAQDAVVNGRPFAENLVKVLWAVNQKLRVEDVDSPLVAVRPVKSVLLVCVTGDRGLCGGYNNFAIKKAEARLRELMAMGLNVKLVTVGKKGAVYFKRRPQYNLAKSFDLGAKPTTKEAQAIADELYSNFVSADVDKVEMVFTKFVSLIASEPTIQTLLPLTPAGEICDIDGKCVDAAEDELFRLTTVDGKLAVEVEKVTTDTSGGEFDAGLLFEQDPVQIIDALLPLYMNATLLRSLQEALASELAARMNAMNSASDNAAELKKKLTLSYNRARQALITNQIIEIVSGASA